MTPTPEETEALRRAEEEARKQQAPVEAGGDVDLFSGLGDLVGAVGSAAGGAIEVVGGVLSGVGSVLDGL